MRSLIIPDIHNKINSVDEILKYEKYDEVHFLGDFFDSFGDTVDLAEKTAKWLKKQMEYPNRYFISGNHDLSYYKNHNNPYARCSGFTLAKNQAINSILSEHDWNKFKFFYEVDGWLLTHAGLHKYHVEHLIKDKETVNINDIINFLDNESTLAFKNIKKNISHWFYTAGGIRGGFYGTVGGIVWCDYREFIPIEGIKQIFGHTYTEKPKVIKNLFESDKNINICLDCDMKYYGILENGKFKSKSAKKLLTSNEKLNKVTE